MAVVTEFKLNTTFTLTASQLAAYELACAAAGDSPSLWETEKLKAETLRRVNQIRMRRGQDAIYELPKGFRRSWYDCVLSRAIGPDVKIEVANDLVLRAFIGRFDSGQLPELEWRRTERDSTPTPAPAPVAEPLKWGADMGGPDRAADVWKTAGVTTVALT